MAEDPFNIGALRVDPLDSTLKPRRVAVKGKWQRKFVRMPWSWVDRLKTANRGTTFRLALFVLYEHWRSKGRPVELTNAPLAAVGVTARSKWRALAELERRGLVKVKKRARKSPLVTILVDPRS